MAKKPATAEIPNGDNNSKSPDLPSTTKGSLKFKIKINSKNKEIVNGDASAEEAQALAVPPSSTASRNDDAGESKKGKKQKKNGANGRIPGNKGDAEAKKENKKRKKGEHEDVKNNDKQKKKSKKEEVVEEEEETEAVGQGESATGYIPMNRVSRIVRSENADLRISQEAIFLINRATEKFLQLFCKEAHACAVVNRKKSLSYNHLSSVVSKLKRFEFLSDFVPEKVKAEDALARVSEADK